jgi:hypothetical protein
MLSGATWSAAAIVGTAVFRIVVSSDSIKNATAISHGSRRLLEAGSEGSGEGASIGLGGLTFIGLGCIGRDRIHQSSVREKPIIADALCFCLKMSAMCFRVADPMSVTSLTGARTKGFRHWPRDR